MDNNVNTHHKILDIATRLRIRAATRHGRLDELLDEICAIRHETVVDTMQMANLKVYAAEQGIDLSTVPARSLKG